MSSSSPWPIIHRERAALADELASVPEGDWNTPSLCDGWTVHQMLGHMVSTAKMTPPKFIVKFAGSGFRFNAMTAKGVAGETAGTASETLAEFRALANDSTAPPGPVDSWLGETIVHGTDIRWPLGLSHDFPVEAVVRVANFYKNSNTLIGAKTRIAGLGLRATDVEWSTGSGPEVTGPILPLVMAMTGRRAALTQLSGPGLDTLAARF
jgi:uncharacterized protein (TIGR03083 family)